MSSGWNIIISAFALACFPTKKTADVFPPGAKIVSSDAP
jgi:hypothetical protein